MSKDALPESVEREIEAVPTIVEVNQNKLQALIAFSDQTEKVGKALDKIRTFVMSRALPGDWVQHGDKINPSGPAAERILSGLGLMGVQISFTNWKYWKDTGIDKIGDYYAWWYSATVEIGGLMLGEIQGRAGSRDKFFGYENKVWKDLSEVKESDVRMAARRDVFKEAIKVALGLRGIPAEQAKVLGLDPSKIRKVEFGQRGETKVDAPDEGTPLTIIDVKPFTKKDAKWTRYEIIESGGAKFSTFDKNIADSAKKWKDDGTKVIIRFTVGKYGNDITEITPAPALVKEEGDAQEPQE